MANYLEAARRKLDWADHAFNDDERARQLAEAQACATIAIAEQLERLNKQLEGGAIEVMYGGRTG